MLMLTVLRPDVNLRPGQVASARDYVSVPAIALRGEWKAADILSDLSRVSLAMAYVGCGGKLHNFQERWNDANVKPVGKSASKVRASRMQRTGKAGIANVARSARD